MERSAVSDTGTGLASLLEDLRTAKTQVVDLTTPLSASTPTLELPEPFVNLIDFSLEEVSAYNEPGPFWKHHNIHTGEHIGTHLDAPTHWATGREGKDVAQIEPARLVGPAVVLDVAAEAAADPDFLVDIQHIQEWESEYGPLPDGGWLLVRTGWDQRSQTREAFLNKDEYGNPHSPGFTVECARWIAQESVLSGVGVETVGIDAGNAAGQQPPFPAHHYLLGNDKYGVTSLRNLTQLPAAGAGLIVAPLPIVGGTGSPARVFALVGA
ncbi:MULTISPECIES: cyclase family protein [unclassified Arthrobacter]|uniref:cyclase family protein n=1 Tax=unclassified Arthrobacter TaxID=235627 RepID=UPI001F2F5A23|nr:cyclase family protein [Arthrobacter sp. FW305-BF8]UKA56268.1 cyclase family protein [Arthrobacter sp. FW305-BF8]